MKKNKNIIFLLILIIFAFVLRVWQINTPSLWIDESFTINASISIAEKRIPLLDSERLYKSGIAYNYIVAGLIKISNFNPFSPWQARIPAIIFGILSILAIYLLSLKLFNKNLAIISSFILSFSSWQIAWSRQARGYTLMQFFIILSFYFLWLWLEKKKIKFLLFFFSSFILSFLGHQISLIFLPAFFIITFFYPNKRFKKRDWIIFFSVFTILPILFFYIFTIPKIKIYNFYSFYIDFIKEEFFILIIFLLIGLFLSLFSNKKYLIFSLFLTIVLPLSILSLFIDMVHYRYLFPLFPFIVIIASYPIIRFFELFQKLIKVKSNLFSIAPSILISLYFFFPLLNFIPKEDYLLEYGSPQPNFKEAYKIIKETRKESDIIISPYTSLSKIYLEDKGLWLPISLSGKTSEIEHKIIDGKDYYTGAPVILSDEDLKKIINTKNGFIIIDQMAKGRLKDTFKIIEENKKTEIIYENRKPRIGDIWLYKF